MLTKEQKDSAIKLNQNSEGDVGSASVQISILTKRIEVLNEHMQKNHKDKHSKRGLVALVEKRKKLLAYLKNKDSDSYKRTIKNLNLRK